MYKKSIPYILILIFCLMAITCGKSPTGPDIDDTRYYPNVVNISRILWQESSKPIQLDESFQKGNMLWHQPRELVPADQVYDDETTPGNASVRTFRLIFTPDESEPSWAGITTSFTTPILEETEFFDFIAKGDHGKIHLEFGYISEDIDNDGIHDNEDMDFSGQVSEYEDVGLDGLADEDEPGYDPVTNPDPNGDNWFFRGEGKCPLPDNQCDGLDWWNDDTLYYKYLNGTEGNLRDPAMAGRPDKESLTNFGFNTANGYYSYTIDLADSEFPERANQYGWKRYKIPLRDSLAFGTFGDPGFYLKWSMIDHVRIWFEGDPNRNEKDTLEIAEMRFLQDTLIEQPLEDTLYFRDYEYEMRRIFDLGLPGELLPGDSIVNLYLFESISDYSNDRSGSLANLYVDPLDTSKFRSENIYNGGILRVKMIAEDQFEFYTNTVENKHYVVFNTHLSPNYHLGAWMVIDRYDGSVDTIGSISDTVYNLKLIAPSESKARPTHMTWQLMWRNCYRIPKHISYDDIKIKIFKGLDGTEGQPDNLDYQIINNLKYDYLKILGLDQYNAMNQKVPDAEFDDRLEIFRPDWGLLIIPHREPFDSDTSYVDQNGNETPPINPEYRLPNIYRYTNFSEKAEQSNFYIKYTVKIQYPY